MASFFPRLYSIGRLLQTDIPERICRATRCAQDRTFRQESKMAAKEVRRAKKTKSKSKAVSHPRRARGASRSKRSTPRKWSRRVTERSDALDLKQGVFKLKSPKAIAASLKRSAERSHRRKADPYRSAMSMLTFYLNRAGKNLPAGRKKTLNSAKQELRKQFHKA
jgi:Protein of unknown function (DUF3175)